MENQKNYVFTQKKHVLAIGFNAGGNPFCPVYSSPEDFERPDGASGFAADAGVKMLSENGCEVLPVFFARARGRMTLETFQVLVSGLFEKIPRDKRIDGVYLNIGGGMLVDFIGNGDAFFVSRLRELLGGHVPIAAPMDFHGGMTYTLWKSLNIITTFRTNPHVDIKDTQERAARLLLKSMESGIVPGNIGVRVPMVIADSLKQEEGAGLKVNHILDRLEEIDGVWSASFMTGSAWSNSPATGCLLTVSCEQKAMEAAGNALKQLAREIWSFKDEYISMNPVVEPKEAFRLADEQPDGPVFIDDSGDNPTNSATGDSAYMLELALRLKQKHLLVAGIWDEGFVRLCGQAGEGAVVRGPLGASVCSSGTQIFAVAQVLGLRRGTGGKIDGAKVKIDGIVVLVTARREGVLNRHFMESFGEDCKSYKKIVVKLGYLLDDFVKIASAIYIARSPGNVDLNFERINASMDKIPRPMYPFDGDFEFAPTVIG